MATLDATLAELMITILQKNNPNIFCVIFPEEARATNIAPNVTAEAERIFKEEFPDDDYTLDQLKTYWQERSKDTINGYAEGVLPNSEICNQFAYDSSKGKNVYIYPPITKKKLSKEFDIFEFLKARQDNGYPIRFQSDADLEADLEVLLEPQKNLVIDAGLRKIARALTVLNSACSYRILDVQSERVVR